jgi:hypothetical protein
LMFDLVPLAGSRREVRDLQRHPQFIRQLLQFDLSQPDPPPVVSARVCGDVEAVGAGVLLRAHLMPPLAQALHGEFRRVMT